MMWCIILLLGTRAVRYGGARLCVLWAAIKEQGCWKKLRERLRSASLWLKTQRHALETNFVVRPPIMRAPPPHRQQFIVVCVSRAKLNRDVFICWTRLLCMCLRGFDRLEKSFLSEAERCLTNGFLTKSDHPKLFTTCFVSR